MGAVLFYMLETQVLSGEDERVLKRGLARLEDFRAKRRCRPGKAARRGLGATDRRRKPCYNESAAEGRGFRRAGEAEKTLQEVNKKIHKQFSHSCGMALTRKRKEMEK